MIIEGDEFYTKVNKNVAPEKSSGWTVVLMDRASRFIWEMSCDKKDSSLFKKAKKTMAGLVDQTEDITLLTDGERRYGNTLFEICYGLLRTGKPGRPRKTLKKGVTVRMKNKRSQAHKRGPKRLKYQATCPQHPETSKTIADNETHANYVEANNSTMRRKCSPYRRKTNTYGVGPKLVPLLFSGLDSNFVHRAGWVERSETQQPAGVGFRSSTQPTWNWSGPK